MNHIQYRSFNNALRILRSLDYHEVSFLTDLQWEHFRSDPYKFFISSSMQTALLIWTAIQKRQPAELKQDV